MAQVTLADLPDEVRQLIEPVVANNPETLDAISLTLVGKRDEAKAARMSSGIEEIWKECEEAYVGIDDANRHEFQDAKWAKPMSMDGPVTTGKEPRNTEYKSTAYVRLTARYVDAGSAKLGEILLPADDKAFSFTETPVPELILAKDDESQVVDDSNGGVPLMRPLQPGEPQPAPTVPAGSVPPVAVPGAAGVATSPAAPMVPLRVKDLAEENIQQARKKAKAAEKRIYDWMVECQHRAEMRKVIADCARIGAGVVKAPTPKAKRDIAVRKTKADVLEVIIRDTIKPASEWKDPWNIFPDPSCGENIHNGDFIFERDYMTPRQVRDLKKLPGYIRKNIDKVLEDGPEKETKERDSNSSPGASKQKGRFEVWYFYGALKREEMQCITVQSGKMEDISKDKKEVFAIVTLINDMVVRATINPLDSGCFPYHSVPWQRRAGHWAGIGVAEQLRMPQRTINAATRAMLNNAGKSAGSQIVIDRGVIRPMDGKWILTPDKFWEKIPDATGDDVRKAFEIYEIPNQTPELMSIIEYALKLAEESTSIPLITQGQTGPTTPDTLGATAIQNNNANQLLRSIGYAFDDYITEPVVRQYYEWLLLDPDVPDDEKGEFNINAHGSAALVERAIQDQTIAQMASFVVNPVYGIDPKKWAKMFIKSKRLDPQDMQYTEEEQARMAAMPPPRAPQVEVAEINRDATLKGKLIDQSTDDKHLDQARRDAEAAAIIEGGRVDATKEKTALDATMRLHELELQKELALLNYANANRMNLTNAHKELIKTHMSRKPPVQAPGRAASGHAFDQSTAVRQ